MRGQLEVRRFCLCVVLLVISGGEIAAHALKKTQHTGEKTHCRISALEVYS